MRKVCLLLLGFGTSGLLACLFVLSMAEANTQGSASAEMPTEAPYAQVMPVHALAPAGVTLPADIAGTTLRAERLVLYEGSFMEDGSHQEVIDVAGLAVRNYGSEMVDQAEVVLRRGPMALHFRFACIPPGETVVALERDRQRCPYQNFTSCSGTQSGPQHQWLRDGEIEVQLLDDNGIKVINRSSGRLPGVTLFYRNYPTEEQIGVGGAAYLEPVGDLEPGGCAELFPNHYVTSVSKIIGFSQA